MLELELSAFVVCELAAKVEGELEQFAEVIVIALVVYMDGCILF